MEKFYSTFDIARICQVSPGSVIRWIHDGKLPASLTAGGHHRVYYADLVPFLKQLRIPVPSELANSEPGTRILVVDDEEGIRTLIRTIINQNFPKIVVEEAGEGFVAGWKTHGFKPHLVILDLMLPGFDGFRVCQFIRSFPELQQTKIMAMTALQETALQDRMMNLGANAFIHKPFDVETMKSKIQELIQEVPL